MKLIKFMGFALVAITIVGCNGHQVKNITDKGVVSYSDKKITTKDVRNAIIKAGVNKGWAIRDISDGVLKGEITVRQHYAVIEITYSDKTYSIKYIDSSNLSYNPSVNTIHGNYNRWISNLDRDIQLNLSRLQLGH